jgi:biotin-dependent carboxylase-like uncharacterized protein
MARANSAAHNAPFEAAIEVQGAVTIAARTTVLVATDDGVTRVLANGDVWTIACERSGVRYAAVRGGVDVPIVLGGRGTLLVASLGGHEGRPLRGGDLLRGGGAHEVRGAVPVARSLDRAIRVVPGPDLDRFAANAIHVLLGSAFLVSSRSNRVGVRLEGPPLPRADDDSATSAPMVRGAIQVPASGQPIVLGPDHPTTGGYPVIATVVRADLGALGARAAGAIVRFVGERG